MASFQVMMPGGGFIVDATTTLSPVNFTDADVSGLAAAVATHCGQPFEAHARAALVKALSGMDAQARARATALSGGVWIDHSEKPTDARVRHAIEQTLHE